MQTNNVETLEADIWAQLQRASVDKHHEWRSPVLVTNGLANEAHANWPEARTIILRAVNLTTKQLTFYTDSRSPKVKQLQANPNAMLLFWSKRLNWQLRIKVNVAIKTEGELVQNTWAKVKQSPSAGDYLNAQAPGELLNKVTEQSLQNTPHFALLIAEVIAIDWLALSREGHQRAKFDAVGAQFLVP